jgi:sugar O-acyltransferase (sialic acid O-acetyltransferase NeuD family)
LGLDTTEKVFKVESRPKILIVGAGGHAKVVADILLTACNDQFELMGFLDDDPKLWGSTYQGYTVLGNLRRLKSIPHDAVVVAIGSNRIRADLFEELRITGEEFVVTCHSAASIGTGIRIGKGTMICGSAIINTESEIGDNVILNTNAIIEHHCKIGNHSHIAPGSILGGNVNVGEGVLVGLGACVLPGVKLGNWSTIGAGAVVNRNVKNGDTVVGVPARSILTRP